MKKIYKYTAIIILVLGAAGYGAAGFLKAPAPDPASLADHGYVQGLPAGTEVSFQVVTPQGETYHRTLNADTDGVTVLPQAPTQAVAIETSDFIVSALSDPESGALSVRATGLQPFSDVEISSGSDIYQTRADWAGMLSEMEVLKLSDTAPNSEVEVAFYGIDGLRSGPSSHLIRVQLALAGGGPTADGVNVATGLGCKMAALAGNILSWHKELTLSNCFPDQHGKQVNLIKGNYLNALMKMTEQLSTVALQQMQIMGSFFDAEQMIKTQRLNQQLQAQAHKDYQPSEQMCRVGSFTRSLAAADHRSYAAKLVLNEVFMARYSNEEGASSAPGADEDMAARISQFKRAYCDPRDNNNGLNSMCNGHGEGFNKMRINKDVDFTRTAYLPWTLDLNFEDEKASPDLEDVIALGKNLFSEDSFMLSDGEKMVQEYAPYMDARQVMAMKNAAHNSYANYIGMKASSPNELGEKSGGAYMKAMMREFGISDADIIVLLGENPSYYAQMEVLSQKMLQHPDFYVNLYDKPANVQRMEVSLQAAQLMRARDIYDSLLRKEMLYALQVELKLAPRMETANAEMQKAVGKGPTK